jgi:hypothetical protein
MSDDAKLRTAASLSAAWDGEPIKRVTVLPGRRLAMHLMAQPDVAAEMLNDRLLADQSILSRFLATAPDAASGARLWREPSPESEVTAVWRPPARHPRTAIAAGRWCTKAVAIALVLPIQRPMNGSLPCLFVQFLPVNYRRIAGVRLDA